MDSKTFNIITFHIQNGSSTGQVPQIYIGFEDVEIDMEQLFKDKVLCWSTNQGMIENVEGKNANNRTLNGYLWLHPQYVLKNIDLLHETFLKNKKGIVQTKLEFITMIADLASHTGPKTSAKYKSMKVEYQNIVKEFLNNQH